MIEQRSEVRVTNEFNTILAVVTFCLGFHVMSTAYELGKRGGSFPRYVCNEAMGGLFESSEIRLIRPTLATLVILQDGSHREISRGFRSEFATKLRDGSSIKWMIENSREDKLDGRMWKVPFKERRCLIQTTSFYESVERHGTKIP